MLKKLIISNYSRLRYTFIKIILLCTGYPSNKILALNLSDRLSAISQSFARYYYIQIEKVKIIVETKQ